MTEKQDKQAKRVFQRGLYENKALREIRNNFILAEVILTVASTSLRKSEWEYASVLVVQVLPFIGLLLTIAWIYVNRRQVQRVQERLPELAPEYKMTYETHRKWSVSSWLTVYALPVLAGVMWVISFLVFTFIP